MQPEIGSIVFGLVSAVVWGAGDFCGGMSTRRAPLLSVIWLSQFAGFVLLFGMALLLHEPTPSTGVVVAGMAAGLAGTVGIAALYRGLAVGRASIVAPLSAVVGALLTALYSVVTIGLPGPLKIIGFVIAFAAIVLVSQANQGEGEGRALGLAILAGLGFGGFFIFAHLGGGESTFFPLAIARATSVPFVLLVSLIRRTSLPPRAALPIIILAGLFDSGGNVFFLIASQFGRLDVATILSSLYPASTVILSRLVLGERTTRLQQLGVVAALIAIALIAV